MTSQLEQYLNLKSFDEYIEKFELFCGLDIGKLAFRKQLELMEKDDRYSHREKEAILAAKKREELRRLHAELDGLVTATLEKGAWITPNKRKKVRFCYRYPNDKTGDIDHYLAGLLHEPKQISDDEFQVTLTGSDYEIIELLVMPGVNLYRNYDFANAEPAMQFLLQYNRIAQIQHLMFQINYYRDEYKSLRSLPDMKLKKLLQSYNEQLLKRRNAIYEMLIGEGSTHPRWISEQKAYAIVREHYPDAKFQYQAEFLYGQRLDIYIPSKNVAIEYQGKQHYEAVEFFGGAEGQKNNRLRDIRKRNRCAANGIKVIYWDYDQPLTDEYFKARIEPQILIGKDTLYIGVDGCAGGWIAAILENGKLSHERFASLQELVEHYPSFHCLLVDMVIGLRNSPQQLRPDDLARKELGPRGSTVFPVPSRTAVYAENEDEQKKANLLSLGKSLSKQTINIIPKIRELDEFLKDHPAYKSCILESHPELDFSRLNGSVLMSRKKEDAGINERVAVLRDYFPELSAEALRSLAKNLKCNPDDIVDATCLAVTASLTASGQCETIPACPEQDETGLFMRLTVPKKKLE